MRRRDFIALAGGAAAWPIVARAQQPTMPVIGFLNGGLPDGYEPMVAAFHQGLKETGYIEARNVLVEYRWAEGHYDRLPALAADLVRREAMVIAANTSAVPAAKAATTTIPIVFVTASDPVAAGFVASLNRPGGNLTGVVTLNVEIMSKRLELLHELIPTATVVALLVNPTSPPLAETTRDVQAAARTLGLELHVLHASTERDFDVVFAKLIQLRAGGLVIGPDPFFVSRREQLGAMALRNAVPTVFEFHEFAAAGGLMSYGAGPTEPFRLMGAYTGRILKGEQPTDLPVQRVTKVELLINLKTAKALGLTFPRPRPR
jgi:putative tryptophan/tyrosine transport system substrate-binding protein